MYSKCRTVAEWCAHEGCRPFPVNQGHFSIVSTASPSVIISISAAIIILFAAIFKMSSLSSLSTLLALRINYVIVNVLIIMDW